MRSSAETTAAPAATLASLIGDTPLVELPRFGRGAARIVAKLEWFNPGGSVKDRIARAMIEDGERRGLLAPGGTIVEPTSGQHRRRARDARGGQGLPLRDRDAGGVRRGQGEADGGFGADVVRTPAVRPNERRDRASPRDRPPDPRRLPAQPVRQPRQPESPLRNDRARDRRVLGDGIDAWVAGRRHDRHVHGRRALPLASGSRGSCASPSSRRARSSAAASPATHRVEGVGLSFLPDILDRSLIDEVVTIDDDEAFETCRRLAREEGLLVAGSSGLAAAAALRVARRLGPGPDRGDALPGRRGAVSGAGNPGGIGPSAIG